MVQTIDPVSANMRLAQLLGESDLTAPAAAAPVAADNELFRPAKVSLSGNPFDDLLAKAIESLNGVSRSEALANQTIERYIKGQADLQEVMVAQSKSTVMAQLAVTTVNAAVTTFKEVTQMQI
jgi:flagellar hook-basal body complex protein FliE